MKQNSKCLAVILARGGSKRLPNKNLLPFNGAPLISSVIKSSLQANCISDTILSTDSELIAQAARESGAQVPFMRPAYLATDSSTSWDALKHAVQEYETLKEQSYEWVFLLQPTSPFTNVELIESAYKKLINSSNKSLITVVKSSKKAQWFGEVIDSKFKPFELKVAPEKKQYIPSGNLYIYHRDFFNQSNAKPEYLAYEVTQKEAIDIDEAFDYELAKRLL